MYNQITSYQQRLFNKLFANLPSIRKSPGFSENLDIGEEINHFYYFKNKDFWFTMSTTEDKYLYLFGNNNKPLKDINGTDTCLIIDFDKNIQFNDNSLGLFSIENSEMHILINYDLLKENYPHVKVADFKKINFKSFDNSLSLDVIDLGNLDDNFIDNIGKLIKKASNSQLQNNKILRSVEKEVDVCQICDKKKSDFEIDVNLTNLKNLKPDLCGECIEKIFVVEFFTKLLPLINGNDAKELENAKEKFGNDKVFDVGMELLEKYRIIQYIGVKKLFYTIDKDSYLVKKYVKYSDKNNLLIDNIDANNDDFNKENIFNVILQEHDDKSESYEKNVNELKINKTDSLMNKRTIKKMNMVLEYLSEGKSEKEAIIDANIPEKTYQYWINRGKQNFGDEYVQFYQSINKIKYLDLDDELTEDYFEEESVDSGIYAPLPEEYEQQFIHTSMNKSGIAWVSKIGNRWIYSKKFNGKTIKFDSEDIYKLYDDVKEANHVWGVRNYSRARKIIDIPEDFEIHSDTEKFEESIEDDFEIDPDIYAPLSNEYKLQFKGNKSKTGIAWVNLVGKQWLYQRSINKQKVYFTDKDIYGLHKQIKQNNLTWGIMDYNKAKKIIDIPEEYIAKLPELQDKIGSDDVNEDILAPLPEKYLASFNPKQKNKTGIAWVSQVGKKWVYQRQINGVGIKFSDSDINKLYDVVIQNGHIWGITDLKKAKKIIKSNEIDDVSEEVSDNSKSFINDVVVVNYIESSFNDLDVIIKGVIKNTNLINVLNALGLFEKNIKRIITTSIGSNVDILIELELNKYLKNTFEEKIKDFGWKINK